MIETCIWILNMGNLNLNPKFIREVKIYMSMYIYNATIKLLPELLDFGQSHICDHSI